MVFKKKYKFLKLQIIMVVLRSINEEHVTSEEES